MIEIGDEMYNYLFPEECNPGIVVSRKSETEFIIEWRNRVTGELYKRTNYDYNIYNK